MTEDDVDPEALLQEQMQQTRATTDATSGNDSTPDLADAVADAYAAIDDNAHPNLSVRDQDLAALFRGLDDAGELASLAAEAANAYDGDVDGDAGTWAFALKALLRYAIQDLDPDTLQAANEGRQQYILDSDSGI